MQFGWKVLIPVSILWILIVATLRVLSLNGASKITLLGFSSVIILIVMALNIAFDSAKKKKLAEPPYQGSAPTFAVPQIRSEVIND